MGCQSKHKPQSKVSGQWNTRKERGREKVKLARGSDVAQPNSTCFSFKKGIESSLSRCRRRKKRQHGRGSKGKKKMCRHVASKLAVSFGLEKNNGRGEGGAPRGRAGPRGRTNPFCVGGVYLLQKELVTGGKRRHIHRGRAKNGEKEDQQRGGNRLVH